MYRIKFKDSISKKWITSGIMSFTEAIDLYHNHKHLLNNDIVLYPDSEYHVCLNCIFSNNNICNHETHNHHTIENNDFCIEWEDKIKNNYNHKDFRS